MEQALNFMYPYMHILYVWSIQLHELAFQPVSVRLQFTGTDLVMIANNHKVLILKSCHQLDYCGVRHQRIVIYHILR